MRLFWESSSALSLAAAYTANPPEKSIPKIQPLHVADGQRAAGAGTARRHQAARSARDAPELNGNPLSRNHRAPPQ